MMVKESTNPSRVFVLTFVDLVDMYEQIMATHYDYNYIREKFGETGVLKQIADLLNQMGDELDNIAYMVLSNTRNKYKPDFQTDLEKLKLRIDEIGVSDQGTSNFALRKILVNLRDLNERIKSIYGNYSSKSSETLLDKTPDYEYSKFVTRQDYAAHIFSDNLSFSSGTFKHALRVALVCLIGFVTAKFIALGHHSYWVLLTIIVILKPGFSLSKQRNYQRLVGTIVGGIAGIIILLYIPNKDIQFGLLIVLMIGSYSFLRLNYVVSVLFTTTYVLILFKFLGVGLVVQERIIDTIIGSTIAFIASNLIFPSWEFEQIQHNLSDVINANTCYLNKISESILGREVTSMEYKLARKDVYVKSANLSAAFERMTSEPKSKQRKVKDVHKFVVLNHILSSYIATIASSVTSRTIHRSAQENLKLIKKTIAVLNDISKKLGGNLVEPGSSKSLNPEAMQAAVSSDDLLLKEQLGFINKISYDIARVTDN